MPIQANGTVKKTLPVCAAAADDALFDLTDKISANGRLNGLKIAKYLLSKHE